MRSSTRPRRCAQVPETGACARQSDRLPPSPPAQAEGCAGASRLLCKSEWDYKLIVKFEDAESLEGFMNEHHPRISEVFTPSLQALAAGGVVHEQNFVYDDIE